ncbi:ATP-binding protein [Thioalkalivibrio sp. HK1]|uniref:ATP-binding protein n=1 Tax=Thioalkalivibrio sp. HK1 TaxID=1469245 RepID=UPI0004725705|nr:ATP-binding protein [Thioalkalivibrio sp. HK1]
MNPLEYPGYLTSLVDRLLFSPNDTRWLEIARSVNPDDIGISISALANSAALHAKTHAYALWGIEDRRRTITGTRFTPLAMKKGDEPLAHWLGRLIKPQIDFRFCKATIGGLQVIVLQVGHAFKRPATFKGIEYVRNDGRAICIDEKPSLKQRLLDILDEAPFEEDIAKDRVEGGRIMRLLDIPTWFRLAGLAAITDERIVFQMLHKAGLIRAGGRYVDITNLGALLLARNLSQFDHLKHKMVRIVRYRGRDRKRPCERPPHRKGYALGFASLAKRIRSLLPKTSAFATGHPRPDAGLEAAIRELLINALVHQDLRIIDEGPQVDVFDDRIEFTNPGKAVMDPARFVDSPPEYRNEALASQTRGLGIRAAWDSGLDKVIAIAERLHLPPPLFEETSKGTKATLYAPRASMEMSGGERLRACYQHACLRQITGQTMTCASFRRRMGFEEDENGTKASARILKKASDAGLVALETIDGDQDHRRESWLPFWAPRKSNFIALE